MNDEKNFVDTYIQLLELADKANSDTFYSTSEYGKLASLGPTLPKFKYALPGKVGVDEALLEVTFKSIKPPHKFTEVLQVSKLATVYAVKGQLINQLGLPIEAGNIKLLLKSKVLQDTASLEGVAEGSMVSVMISAAVKAVEHVEVEEIEDPKLIISESTWDKIKILLEGDLGPGAEEVLVKFKLAAR